MAPFDYAAYYRRLQEIKKLQIPAASVCWTEQYQPPERAYDIVLYLGCNILRTPDIAADVVAVFRALGLDFIAVAGVQFCCGITWDRVGDVAKGQSVTDLTIERLASYQARTVVHWCPSCDVHFSDVVTGRDAKSIPFEVTNAPAFLAALSQRGQMPWRKTTLRRAALHCHQGREGHASGRRRARADHDHVSQLLSQIPGLHYLGAVTAPPEFDYDCGPSSIRVERAQWLASRTAQVEGLRQLGADTVVTVSHACQREWCDVGDPTLSVCNYISLVAESIGCARPYEGDSLGQLKRLNNPQAIVERTRASWASHGLRQEQAEAIARKYTWATPSPRSSAP
jgi:hypothetical protein